LLPISLSTVDAVIAALGLDSGSALFSLEYVGTLPASKLPLLSRALRAALDLF
jgi:hypothetical protein